MRTEIKYCHGIWAEAIWAMYCENASWGIACYQEKDARYDCNWAIQKRTDLQRRCLKWVVSWGEKEKGRERSHIKKNSTVMGSHRLFLLYGKLSNSRNKGLWGEEWTYMCAWLHPHRGVYAVCVCKCLHKHVCVCVHGESRGLLRGLSTWLASASSQWRTSASNYPTATHGSKRGGRQTERETGFMCRKMAV